jgi:hypothetical protein
VQEVASTPGIDFIVDFVDVEDFDYVQVIGQYDGTHSVSVQLYCWQTAEWHTWDSINESEVTMTNHSFWVPCPANYIGTGGDDGKVRVRFNHTQAGNPAHILCLDVVALYDRCGYLEDLIDALEAENQKVINVYDDSSTGTSSGGTKGTGITGAGASGGVYPSRC